MTRGGGGSGTRGGGRERNGGTSRGPFGVGSRYDSSSVIFMEGKSVGEHTVISLTTSRFKSWVICLEEKKERKKERKKEEEKSDLSTRQVGLHFGFIQMVIASKQPAAAVAAS